MSDGVRAAAFAALVAGPLLLMRASPAGTSGGFAVRIQEPDRADLLAGRVVLRAEVTAPPGLAVVEVQFVADGLPLGTDREPPFEAAWGRIDPLRDHLLRATAVAADGSRAYGLLSIPVLGPVERARKADLEAERRQSAVRRIDVDPLGEDGGRRGGRNEQQQAACDPDGVVPSGRHDAFRPVEQRRPYRPEYTPAGPRRVRPGVHPRKGCLLGPARSKGSSLSAGRADRSSGTPAERGRPSPSP
jgi:hypothetical protein